uniref:Uncharacterized protein n=1 Tax=Arundo donax TaxID=35708 RepID=A0A0A9AG33_ARUDO
MCGAPAAHRSHRLLACTGRGQQRRVRVGGAAQRCRLGRFRAACWHPRGDGDDSVASC